MVLVKLKCQRCGYRFEATALDRDDPRESEKPGKPIRCPQCSSTMLETTELRKPR